MTNYNSMCQYLLSFLFIFLIQPLYNGVYRTEKTPCAKLKVSRVDFAIFTRCNLNGGQNGSPQ